MPGTNADCMLAPVCAIGCGNWLCGNGTVSCPVLEAPLICNATEELAVASVADLVRRAYAHSVMLAMTSCHPDGHNKKVYTT